MPPRKILTRNQIPLFYDCPDSAPAQQELAKAIASLAKKLPNCALPAAPEPVTPESAARISGEDPVTGGATGAPAESVTGPGGDEAPTRKDLGVGSAAGVDAVTTESEVKPSLVGTDRVADVGAGARRAPRVENAGGSAVTVPRVKPRNPSGSASARKDLVASQEGSGWLERYRPAGTACGDNQYFRFAWISRNKRRAVHLPGGNCSSSLAGTRAATVESLIAAGTPPSKIVEVVKSRGRGGSSKARNFPGGRVPA
jgi:hypothetical protein